MLYAKLIDNIIKWARNPIVYRGFRIANPPAEIYLDLGYKPVHFTDPPEVELSWEAVYSWREDPEEIVQVWTVIQEL